MSRPSSRDRLESALARIVDPAGEGARAVLTVYADRARAEADAADRRAALGVSLGPLDGAIVTIKDLFDVAGEPTRAGSRTLVDAAPAAADAPVIGRLRRAGAVIVAKTNMTEFAFGAMGMNPHFGTPGNPADRTRVPGGSTSGGAVAVADGMSEITIGSDTGGSTRIPAALCGIVGFKPTQARIPLTGAFPLSYSLDSIGPLARSVQDCADADAVMAGDDPVRIVPQMVAGLRLGVMQGQPLDRLEDGVAEAFSWAMTLLGAAGARLSDVSTPLWDEMLSAQQRANGALSVTESGHVHADLLKTPAWDLVDPNIGTRIRLGTSVPAADYIHLLRERARIKAAWDGFAAGYDALIWPTVPILAPVIADASTYDTYMPKNLALLRNCAPVNFMDCCAISLPMPWALPLPAGFMLVGRHGHDRRLFEIAAAVEKLFADQ
jgi:aspartyl-tRNA(Asn)/glutamyl-tRNA(Gln) amidotransferase subunit A